MTHLIIHRKTQELLDLMASDPVFAQVVRGEVSLRPESPRDAPTHSLSESDRLIASAVWPAARKIFEADPHIALHLPKEKVEKPNEEQFERLYESMNCLYLTSCEKWLLSTFASREMIYNPSIYSQFSQFLKDISLRRAWAKMRFLFKREDLPDTDASFHYIRTWLSKERSLLTTIQALDLSEADLLVIPEELQWFTELTDLDLSFNAIKVLPPQAFLKLGKLERIELGHNPLFRAYPKAFEGLSALQILSLTKHKIPSSEMSEALRSLPDSVLNQLEIRR